MPRLTFLAPALLPALLAAPAFASSSDAWAEFEADVEAACRILAQADYPNADPAGLAIAVNPYGSESYGAAIVTIPQGNAGPGVAICIYDKTSQTAELTAPFLE